MLIGKDIGVEWTEGESKVSTLLSWQYNSPPTENTDYTLSVYDKFDCGSSATVTYESLVTKAEFTADPMEGEAPLTVTFTNTSENGTSGYYECVITSYSIHYTKLYDFLPGMLFYP